MTRQGRNKSWKTCRITTTDLPSLRAPEDTRQSCWLDGGGEEAVNHGGDPRMRVSHKSPATNGAFIYIKVTEDLESIGDSTAAL